MHFHKPNRKYKQEKSLNKTRKELPLETRTATTGKMATNA
jgi:hypothetical protein